MSGEAGKGVGATPADASVAELVMRRTRKANTALLALRDLPPIPLQGAFVRASNIMSEIRRSRHAARSPGLGASRRLSALSRRLIYIMCKCPAATPLRSAAVKCAAHIRLCLPPLRAPVKASSDYPSSLVSAARWLQPLRVFRGTCPLPSLHGVGSVEISLPAHAGRLAPCSNRQGQALRVLRCAPKP